jgi:hypothetical protein
LWGLSSRKARGHSLHSNIINLICIIVVAFASNACVRDESDPGTTQAAAGGTGTGTGTGGTGTGGTGTGDGGSAPPPDDQMPPPVDPNPPMDPPPLADQVLFEQTLYPHLVDANNFCVSCHGQTQIPTFAVSDVTAAYNQLVAQQKVDLTTPNQSRVYLRVAMDRHNCGGDAVCDRIAADFLAAIESWSSQTMPPIPPSGTAILSATTTLADGVANGGTRVEDAQIALFTFSEGTGDVTMDSSGFGDPITLQITGMEWVEGGLHNINGKAQASLEDSRKLFDAITPVGEYTVEAWLVPDNTTQDGPARIVSYSESTTVRNFALGQNAIYYQLRNRTAASNANGNPALEALDPQVDTVLQHVVATFDQNVGRKIYINGQLALEEDAPDTLAWTDTQIFVIGNEVTDNRTWQGVLNLVSIHNRALTDVEVAQNYEAGSGNFTTLSFDISSIVGGQSAIEVRAAALDNASYVLVEPTLVSDVVPLRVKNIRIGVNGNIPVAAQTFRRVDMTAMQSGEQLSRLGAVIPIAMGPDMDVFHLEFEELGNRFGLAEAIAPSAPPAPVPDVPEPLVGVRTFSQVNATMSSLTGVSAGNANVAQRYADLRDSLPATPDPLAFSSAHQIAIQQLATTYCGEIVNNAGMCTDFFGACSVDGNAKDAVATTLYDSFIGDNIATQPDSAAFTTEIVRTLDDLGCANGCTGATAQTALQATCAATLASGAVTFN